MDNFGAIIAAAISAIIGPLLLFWVQRRRRLTSPPVDPFKALRDKADLWEANSEVWKEKYEQGQHELELEKAARTADRALATSDKIDLVAKLRDTERDLDNCERQKDDAYAELREVARRKLPRTAGVEGRT